MNVKMAETHKTIFLVEDNKADVRLIQEALKIISLPHQVVTVRDGIEAITYLHQEGEYTNALRPDLILLDLNLPQKNGIEVLEEIKSDPRLKSIPVIILTTSKNQDDILRCYNLHANCYIAKPRNLNQLFQIIKNIEEFWFSTAILP
ncbi:MAG: response regulator [Dolichospermum sp. DET50]|nr:response regulator [Dolichospermum sp. DET66]MBS3034859.1 response regulator [Dolichospermum sp. DET67]MBS3040062.1 response regulator [Dolichospermum sp. DET50]QSX67240.1 MAG: response regulator [Dolichospermum sp. DET69]